MTDQELKADVHGDALNEAVARKLGLSLCGCKVTHLPMSECDFKPHVQDYCHSIAVAWEIIHQLKNDWTMWHDKDGYHFWIWEDVEKQITLASEYASTAPMAICLAFLKLP